MRAAGMVLLVASAALAALGFATISDTTASYWLFALCCGGVGVCGMFDKTAKGIDDK